MSEFELNTQDDLLDNLLSDFLDEADQLLAHLNDNLLQLDEWVQTLDGAHARSCDGELLNEMFRAAHSLKGLSAMLGLSDINNLTHKIENVFDAARKDELGISRDVVDLVFMGLDRLTALVDLLKDPQLEPVDCDAVVDSIRILLQDKGVERKQSSQAEAERALAELIDAQTDRPPVSPPPLDVAPPAAIDPFEAVSDEEDISDRYLSIFVDEAEPSLEEISAGLLALDSGDREEDLRHLLAGVHKLKGSSASIGLNRSAKFAHLIEDILEDAHDRTLQVSQEMVELLLRSTDTFQQYIADLRKGVANASLLQPLACELVRFHRRGATGSPGSITSQVTRQSAAPESAEQPVGAGGRLAERLERVVSEVQRRLASADPQLIASRAGIAASTVARARDGGNVKLDSIRTLANYLDTERLPHEPGILYSGCVTFEPGLDTAGLKAELICEKLAKLGTVVGCVPSVAELETIDQLDCFRFQLLSTQSVGKICQQLRIAGVKQVAVAPESASPADPIDLQDHPSGRADELLDASVPGSTDTRTVQSAAWPRGDARVQGGHPTPEPETDATRPGIANRGAELVSADTPPSQQTSQLPPPFAAPTPDEAEPGSDDVRCAATSPAGGVKPTAPPANAATAKEPRERAVENGSRPTETVRVDIDRLDALMDLAGQLVINRAQFTQINEKLAAALHCRQSAQALGQIVTELQQLEKWQVGRADTGHVSRELQGFHSQLRRMQGCLEPLQEEVRALTTAREHVRELSEAIHHLHRVSDGIQQGVMDTRMVPVGPLFARFKRVVRDITRANGKEVSLVIKGEKTELDKRMIDELGDPLVHMVRNSADHGIESPQERIAQGKPRQGTVTLDACHRGNSIVIQVHDDGKGLDTERILKKCLEKGLVTPDEAEKMTPYQIHQMIWEPGLSTADKVTDVSGRGMGMDIVRSKIEDLNGTVDIESVPGKGTSITIKLPLTLAILPSLMVDIGGDVFAMPMEAVIEIVNISAAQLKPVRGRPTAVIRGRVVSLIQLGDVMTFHGSSRSPAGGDSRLLVVFGEPGREIGLIVDRVIGEEDIVIKSIAENFRNIQGVAGASILGDGRVSLILDTATLIEKVSDNPQTNAR